MNDFNIMEIITSLLSFITVSLIGVLAWLGKSVISNLESISNDVQSVKLDLAVNKQKEINTQSSLKDLKDELIQIKKRSDEIEKRLFVLENKKVA